MDAVVAIFQQLGANESLVYQFAIFVIVFLVAKFGFFNHLQAILDTRVEKTVKLEGNAEAKFEEVNKLSAEYKEKIKTANKEAKSKVDAGKMEITKAEEARYRQQETEVNKYVESSRAEVQKEVQAKKDEVMNEADQLANSLVQKITKG
ncbi:MAG: ATP synthase F0 subunit B [Bacteriovoracaceae bacterium]|nr:ATP synthase F0 subunit B [Bacteriovoracaceae bacterium]